jgi:predicted HTH transcriptional regulator
LLDKHVYTKEIKGKQVIFIEVPRAERQFRPVYLNKDVFSGTYHRNGEEDYHCTKDDISEMFRDATVASTDTKALTEMNETVFCKDSINAYRNRFRSLHVNHVWDSLDDTDFLCKIGAIGLSSETGKLHPTAAELIMFGYEYEIVREFPQYFLDYQ